MVPYRYSDTDPTKWLWVSEGVTHYYSNVARVRSGILDSTGFYKSIATEIAATGRAIIHSSALRRADAPASFRYGSSASGVTSIMAMPAVV